MLWYHVVACFFGGVFLANFAVHFFVGISGRSFPTPFAKPPFRGLSSAPVNLLWSLFNLAVAYVLLMVAGNFDFRSVAHLAVAAAGVGFGAFGIARSIRKLQRVS